MTTRSKCIILHPSCKTCRNLGTKKKGLRLEVVNGASDGESKGHCHQNGRQPPSLTRKAEMYQFPLLG